MTAGTSMSRFAGSGTSSSMPSSRLAFLLLAAFACVSGACARSSTLLERADAGAGDAGARDDAAAFDARSDAPVTLVGTAECDEAPLLPLDVTVREQPISDAVAPPPSPASCWSGLLLPSLFYRIELPPLTGAEVRAQVTDGGPRADVSFTDRCAPPPGSDQCAYYQTTFVGPNAASFVSNSTDSTIYVVVRVSFEEPLSGTVAITTVRYDLGNEIVCDRAPALPPDAPVVSGRGNVIDNCDYTAERVFHTVTLPPRTKLEPLDGVPATPGAWSCTCGVPPELRNTADSPAVRTVASPAQQRVGWTAVDLEPNATCDRAIAVAASAPAPPAALDRGGDLETGCDLRVESPLYYSVLVPAATRVTVTATPSGTSGDSGLVVLGMTGCAGSCIGTNSGLAIYDVALTWENAGSADRELIVAVGIDGGAPSGSSVSVRAELEPL